MAFGEDGGKCYQDIGGRCEDAKCRPVYFMREASARWHEWRVYTPAMRIRIYERDYRN